MDNLPTIGKKDFWQRTEGTFGKVGLVLLGLGAVGLFTWFWTAISAFVISAMSSLLTAVLLCSALGATLLLVLNPNVWRALGALYKVGIYKFVNSLIIPLDPIAICKIKIADMRKNLGIVEEKRGALQGEIVNLNSVVANNTKIAQHALELAQVAKSRGDADAVALNANIAQRKQESNAGYADLQARMKYAMDILDKMYKNAKFVITDTEDAVKEKEIYRKTVRASYGAFSAAMTALRGDDFQNQLYDSAMENIATDITMKLGEIQNFISISSDLMTNIDLENGARVNKGMQLLDDWSKNGKSTLLKHDKDILVMQAHDVGGAYGSSAVPVKSNGQDYSELLTLKR